MEFKKNIPNMVTIIRIIGTVCLLFIRPLTSAFYVVYTVAGVSDVVDGFLARTMKLTSELGARLDSVADLSFYAVMLFKILPVLFEILPVEIWNAVTGVIIIRLIAYVIVAIKHRRFSSMHTYMNKLTGIAVFLIPYVLGLSFAVGFCWGVCIIAAIASLEEVIIHMIQKEYDSSRKTLFGKNIKKV